MFVEPLSPTASHAFSLSFMTGLCMKSALEKTLISVYLGALQRWTKTTIMWLTTDGVIVLRGALAQVTKDFLSINIQPNICWVQVWIVMSSTWQQLRVPVYTPVPMIKMTQVLCYLTLQSLCSQLLCVLQDQEGLRINPVSVTEELQLLVWTTEGN